MKFKTIIILFVVSLLSIYPQKQQKILVEFNKENFFVSCLSNNGNFYISSKELAGILSSSYYYNAENHKIEIKFSDYSIKFTANNNFIVLTRKKDNVQSVYQLPISTILSNDDIFIPIIFVKDYLSIASKKMIVFDLDTRKIVVNDISNEKNKLQIDYKKFNIVFDIYGLSIEKKINGTLIRLKANKKIIVPRYSIHNDVLYVFFASAIINPELTKDFVPIGLIKNFKIVSTSEKSCQLEFELKDGYSTIDLLQDDRTNDLIITIHNKKFIEQIKEKSNRQKWNFDVVVIDPGHGGKDAGTISLTGTKEKDINLKIALKLGRLIEKNLPSIKVVYTRKSDEFVELYKRGKIANEANGKLFISIHCNSTPQKNITNRGFEVYLLRPGRTKEAIAIAEIENSVINYEDNPERYQQLTDENFILVTMAHSQYMRYSEMFSDLLNQQWKKTVSIPSNGIKQAGFYVLVGASMPSVLIETGYLNNRKDEAYLKSSSGQNAIANAIFNAIVKYKELYEKEIDVLSEREK